MGQGIRKRTILTWLLFCAGVMMFGCCQHKEAKLEVEPQAAAEAEPCEPDDENLTAEQINARIKGKIFVSEEQGEAGLGYDGPIMGYWEFYFSRRIFKWYHSDVEEAGYYSVSEDGRIIASYNGKEIEIPHECNLTRIKWQGMWYRLRRR